MCSSQAGKQASIRRGFLSISPLMVLSEVTFSKPHPLMYTDHPRLALAVLGSCHFQGDPPGVRCNSHLESLPAREECQI
ncbi:hypothetical protein TNCV_1035151 [Trichonephila clavipes]|nr:hypothetical protein TNCV_1035151 [Trichonephila clavipes]